MAEAKPNLHVTQRIATIRYRFDYCADRYFRPARRGAKTRSLQLESYRRQTQKALDDPDGNGSNCITFAGGAARQAAITSVDGLTTSSPASDHSLAAS